MNDHLNESDFDALMHLTPKLEPEKWIHLNTCPECAQHLEQAKTIEAGLKSLPKPTLGFDLVSLVMPGIEKLQPESNRLAIAIQSLIWGTIILFITSCIYFREYFMAFRIEMNDSLIPVLLIPLVFYMIWQAIDLVKNYLKSMDQLNLL